MLTAALIKAVSGTHAKATYRTRSGRTIPILFSGSEMMDREGKLVGIVTDTDFLGGPALIFFGYTHCPDVCPTTLFELSEIFAKLGKDRKIAALFITVDPERDTPAVLKDYLASFDSRILGLSGDPAAIEAVKKAYRVYAKRNPGENGSYLIDHTALVYLLDKQGRFVNAFNLERPPEEAAKELAAYF